MSTATENKISDDNVIDGAITEVKPVDNTLVVTNPEQYAKELFAPFNTELATAKRKAARIQYDVKTLEGMEQAKDLRNTFVKIRTRADKLKTERKRPIDQAGKAILAGYNALEAAAKTEEAKHDKAIRDEEARIAAEKQRQIDEERVRVEALQQKVDGIRKAPSLIADANSDQLRAVLEETMTRRIDPAEFQDHTNEALEALNESIEELRRMVDVAMQREAAERQRKADQEELARLKAEQAERERVAAAEAAEQARLARIERERAEADRKAAAEREADLQRQLAEMRAQMEAAQRAAAPTPTALGDDPRTVPLQPGEIIGIPLVSEGQPVTMGVDLAAPAGDETTEWLAGLPSMAEIVAQPARPTDGEIIEALAVKFEASEDTVTGWLRDLVKGLEA